MTGLTSLHMFGALSTESSSGGLEPVPQSHQPLTAAVKPTPESSAVTNSLQSIVETANVMGSLLPHGLFLCFNTPSCPPMCLHGKAKAGSKAGISANLLSSRPGRSSCSGQTSSSPHCNDKSQFRSSSVSCVSTQSYKRNCRETRRASC